MRAFPYFCKQLAASFAVAVESGKQIMRIISLKSLPNRRINRLEPMKTNYPISSVLIHKTSALWSIAPEATVFEAIKLMADKKIGSLLVMSSGKLAGVFTE